MNEKLQAKFVGISEQERAVLRVELAKDVLERLDRLNVRTGAYIKLDEFDLDKSCNIKDNLSYIEKYCDVCALGGLFISFVDKFNELKFEDVDSIDGTWSLYLTGIEKQLQLVFDLQQLIMIEWAFERRNNGIYFSYYDEPEERIDEAENLEEGEESEFTDDGGLHLKYYQCINFSSSHSPHVRLREIMENVVRNNGTFIP